MKSLLTLVFCLFAVCTFSQTKLEGVVVDAETGEAIPFVNVALFLDGVLIVGTDTDFEGYYSFTGLAEGVYDIELTSTGYFPTKVNGMEICENKAHLLNMRLESGLELRPMFICCFCPPLVDVTNTTQGKKLDSDEIRRLPFR